MKQDINSTMRRLRNELSLLETMDYVLSHECEVAINQRIKNISYFQFYELEKVINDRSVAKIVSDTILLTNDSYGLEKRIEMNIFRVKDEESFLQIRKALIEEIQKDLFYLDKKFNFKNERP